MKKKKYNLKYLCINIHNGGSVTYHRHLELGAVNYLGAVSSKGKEGPKGTERTEGAVGTERTEGAVGTEENIIYKRLRILLYTIYKLFNEYKKNIKFVINDLNILAIESTIYHIIKILITNSVITIVETENNLITSSFPSIYFEKLACNYENIHEHDKYSEYQENNFDSIYLQHPDARRQIPKIFNDDFINIINISKSNIVYVNTKDITDFVSEYIYKRNNYISVSSSRIIPFDKESLKIAAKILHYDSYPYTHVDGHTDDMTSAMFIVKIRDNSDILRIEFDFDTYYSKISELTNFFNKIFKKTSMEMNILANRMLEKEQANLSKPNINNITKYKNKIIVNNI